MLRRVTERDNDSPGAKYRILVSMLSDEGAPLQPQQDCDEEAQPHK